MLRVAAVRQLGNGRRLSSPPHSIRGIVGRGAGGHQPSEQQQQRARANDVRAMVGHWMEVLDIFDVASMKWGDGDDGDDARPKMRSTAQCSH